MTSARRWRLAVVPNMEAGLNDVKRMLYSEQPAVTPRRLTNFRLDDELLDALRTIKDRDGVPISEQVRRALDAWVKSKGVTVKAERQRAGTRKRP